MAATGAQHPAVTTNNNEKFRSFKSKEIFTRKKLGHTAVSASKSRCIKTWLLE